MKGDIFRYHPEKPLIGVQFGEFQYACIVIGGLTDGLLNPSYITPLTTELTSHGWAVVNPILSCSYLGYGISSLEQDAADIEALIKHLVEKRGVRSIVLCGHSTGCQDSIWFMKRKNFAYISRVIGIILQGPASDREFMMSGPRVEKTTKYLSMAEKLISEGQKNELLPREADTAPITAYRFHSLASKDGDDDLSQEEMNARIGHVNVPVLIVFSMNDEYVPSHVEKTLLVAKIQTAMKNKSPLLQQKDHCVMIDDANHDLSSSPNHLEQFVDAVVKFLSWIKH